MGKKSRLKKELKEKFTPDVLRALKKMRKNSKPETFQKVDKENKKICEVVFNPEKRMAKMKIYKNALGKQALQEVFDKNVRAYKNLQKTENELALNSAEEKNDK
jgi:hypothetical protein